MRDKKQQLVVVEVSGGIVNEVHNTDEWLAIDWDIFDGGPTDEEIADFAYHVKEVAPYVDDEEVRARILNDLAEQLRKAGWSGEGSYKQ